MNEYFSEVLGTPDDEFPYITTMPAGLWFYETFGPAQADQMRVRWWRAYLRTILSERQNHRCCYCGVRMSWKRDRPDSVSLEHVRKRIDGGRSHPDNLVTCCVSCNSERRGGLAAETFIPARARLFGAP